MMQQPVRGFEDLLTREAVELLLRGGPGIPPDSSFVCVGDVIDTSSQEGFLRGHGTQVVDEQLVATVCGVVERVNKLVAVRPVKSRYSAEVGDIVVGRVTEISGKRWRVDLRARQAAALLLSAVNLPGGVQRRRTAEDELNMRSFFQEGDLISAEVQSIHHDGSVMLHARSRKYGKLSRGQMVEVPAGIIKRQKQHFVTLQQIGVDVILGVNGMIWVSPHVPQPDSLGPMMIGEDTEEMEGVELPAVTAEEHEAVARVANAIKATHTLYFAISVDSILDTYQLSLSGGVSIPDMLEADFLSNLVEEELSRRNREAAAKK